MKPPTDGLLPWGYVLVLMYRVPRIVPGANKVRAGKGKVWRDEKAEAFRDHVSAATFSMLGDLKRKDPVVSAVNFPLPGEECQIRADTAFGFSRAGRGPARMRASDRDNLAKMFYDGLEGALIDDDRWITEGYIAKGEAPDDIGSDEVIFCAVSRAGFRSAEHLQALCSLGPLPPWYAEAAPQAKKIIRPQFVPPQEFRGN